MSSTKDYILGTDREELDRLGFQHRVWSEDAFSLWKSSGLGRGMRVLDLGCGPGFATFDMAEIVGPEGEVVGIDKSSGYIQYAAHQAEARGVTHVSFIEGDVAQLNLDLESFDFIYTRWVFSWIKDVEPIIHRVAKLLKPGGRFACQEYLQWGTFRIEPERTEVRAMIEACRESWRVMESEIDIGANIPEMMVNAGLEVNHIQPLEKIASPGQMVWQWPMTFLHIYSHKLIEMGLMTTDQRDAFVAAWPEMEATPNAFIVTPLMLEVIGVKA